MFSRPLVLALAVTATAGLILWVVLARLLPPSIWAPAERIPQQCEACALDEESGRAQPTHAAAALARTIREPQNTWSCLAYFLVAALVVQRTRDRLVHWLGLATAVLGVGAILYHASGTREMRHIDMAALYFVYALLLATAATRLDTFAWLRRFAGRPLALVTVAATLAVLVTAFRNVRLFGWKPLHVTVTTGVTIALVAGAMFFVCLRRRDARGWGWWLLSLVLLAAGLVLQLGDHPGGWACAPDAPVQAHALWHVLSAASLLAAVECLEIKAPPTCPR